MNPIHLVAHSDDWVSGRVHGWRPPRWVQVWMVASTRLGDGWVWLVMVVLAPARPPLAETVIAIVAVNTAQVALKRAFRRARPTGPVSWWDIHAPDQVEIPRLDLVEPIDRGSPAQFFNLLPDITGALKVRLIEADRTVGRIVVSPPKPKPKRESDRRRANESGRRA